MQLDRLRRHPRPGQNDTGTDEDGSIRQDSADPSDTSFGVVGQGAAGADTTQAWEAIEAVAYLLWRVFKPSITPQASVARPRPLGLAATMEH